MKLRFTAMAVAIVAGVGCFLSAQKFDLVPRAWSNEQSSYLIYMGKSGVEAYSAAVDARPDNYMAYYHRGLYFQTKGDLNRAVADLDKAVALSPSPLSAEALGQAASSTLSQESRTLNRVVLVRLARADILRQLGRTSEALADMDHAIALDSRRPSVLFSRATLRALIGSYDAAIADFDRILARRPEVNWYFGRGMAKYDKGDFSQAVADFREAARREPANESYQVWLTKASAQTEIPQR